MRLIDADVLKKTLEKLWNVHDDQDFANKDVWREIENAPTIDPEKRTVKANYLGFQAYKCECGFYLRRFYDGVQVYFCPKCGAKLEWSNDD